VSASNDHTARFWSRERPGEEVGGGKPPPGGADEDGMDGMDGDGEDAFVPGLGFGGNVGLGFGIGGQMHSQSQGLGQRTNQDPILPPGFVPITNGSSITTTPSTGGGGSGYGYSGHGRHQQRQTGYQSLQPQQQPILSYSNVSYEPGSGSIADMDDGIPGFGGGIPGFGGGGGGGGIPGFGGNDADYGYGDSDMGVYDNNHGGYGSAPSSGWRSR
jgi:hypothetical protein